MARPTAPWSTSCSAPLSWTTPTISTFTRATLISTVPNCNRMCTKQSPGSSRNMGLCVSRPPLLFPGNRKLYEGSQPACFMDHSGMLVTLPYDLRIAFARFVARNNITHFKRWSIERVFRPRKLNRVHPRELLECSFDVIVPVTNSLLPDAETIFTISEIIQEFSVLQERNYHIYLNHTSLLKAILLHSGIPEDKLSHASSILCDAMSEKLTR
uniref:Uncharacterized protein n=1 Tax=Hucho hucho TaxID=62062 RepID=A0A4W5N4R0_9TELE